MRVIGSTAGRVILGEGESRFVVNCREVPALITAIDAAYSEALALDERDRKRGETGAPPQDNEHELFNHNQQGGQRERSNTL